VKTSHADPDPARREERPVHGPRETEAVRARGPEVEAVDVAVVREAVGQGQLSALRVKVSPFSEEDATLTRRGLSERILPVNTALDE
jgi:hypothetical protein